MPNPFIKFLKNMSEKIYEHFNESSGKMLLTTGVIGILASSLAQSVAILLNNKYSSSQKGFMIPQELTEGLITVFSMFFITKPIQKISSKMIKSGKILSKEMSNILKEHGLAEKRGSRNFDFETSINEIITKIKNTDTFIKASDVEKQNMISKYEHILDDFAILADSTSAYATTGGAMLSTVLIAPHLRNFVASKYQKKIQQTYEINQNLGNLKI